MISQGILLGLTASFAFGLLDILISFASRRIGIIYSLALAQAISACLLLVPLVNVFFSGMEYKLLLLLLFIGIGLGLINTLANLSLYKGLALGPMALVSPISSCYGLVTTLLAVILFQEKLSLLQILAIVLIFSGLLLSARASKPGAVLFPLMTTLNVRLFAIVTTISTFAGILLFGIGTLLHISAWLVILLSFTAGSGIFVSLYTLLPSSSLADIRLWWRFFWQRYKGLLFAFGSMVGFGVEFFCISQAAIYVGPTQPILWSRLCSATALFIYAYRKQTPAWKKIKLSHLGIIALIALFDNLGMIWYTLGTGYSETSIVATLSSTYMLLPTLVGVVAYHEKLTQIQWVGICTILAGVFFLSLVGG